MTNRLSCPECNRFFGFESIKKGEVRLRCPNCKAWVILVVVDRSSEEDKDELSTETK